MNSTHRFIARIGSACALLVALSCGYARAESATFAFQNRSITFTHLSRSAGALGIGVNDPAFTTLLHAIGASLTWRAGERYVLITSALPQVINFSVGDRDYQVGDVTATAAFAPYVIGNEAFVPFDDAMQALGLADKRDGAFAVLQPQLASVDVQGAGAQAVVVAHAGIRLNPRIVESNAQRVTYEFDGVASTLPNSRTYDAGGIREIDLQTVGSVRNPKTLLTVQTVAGTRHDVSHSARGDFEVGFGANGSAPPMVAAAVGDDQSAPSTFEPVVPTQTPVTPAPQDEQPASNANGAASVTGVTVSPNDTGAVVNVAVSGNAQYSWHRLRPPDNRFWVDISSAQMPSSAGDLAVSDPLASIRERQIDPQTVRVALSFSADATVAVSPSAGGLAITVTRSDDLADAPHAGSGSIGTVVSANEPQTTVTPVPPEDYGQNPAPPDDGTWKFGGSSGSNYVPTNPHLIVIDPGHGGDDRGSVHSGYQEADLNFDMAKRLQSILIAQGWQVRMTRTTDHDVDATAKSSAEAESMGYHSSAAGDLQARDDIANASGARLFISIHSNAFINSGPSGTTTYYYKPSDLAFARALESKMSANLGTKDDGVIKVKYYVIAHASMPAALVETAFLTNPSDLAKLADPTWREHVAQDIADAIDAYTTQNPVSGANQ